ncbi:phage head closure protein [Lacticaseibacillus sp. GG6-2]
MATKQPLTNQLRWVAKLLSLQSTVDADDRPVQKWVEKRSLYYADIGITATEKYLAQQSKQDVVLRVMIRRDTSITQAGNRIRIKGVDYKITRIYEIPGDQTMEVSLDYVDHI